MIGYDRWDPNIFKEAVRSLLYFLKSNRVPVKNTKSNQVLAGELIAGAEEGTLCTLSGLALDAELEGIPAAAHGGAATLLLHAVTPAPPALPLFMADHGGAAAVGDNGAAGNGRVKGGGGGSATPCDDAFASPALVEAAVASAVPSPMQWHRQKQVVHGGNANVNNGGGSSSSSSGSQSFTQWRQPVHHRPHAASSASAAGGGGHAVARGAEEKFPEGKVVSGMAASVLVLLSRGGAGCLGRERRR